MTSVTTPGAQSLLIQVYNACCWAWKVCHASDDGKHPLEKQKFFPTGDAHKRRENSVCIFAGNIAGCLPGISREDLPAALHDYGKDEIKGLLIDSSGSLCLQPVISEQLLTEGCLTQKEQAMCFVQFVFLSCLDELVMDFARMCIGSMLGIPGKSSHLPCKQSNCTVSTDHVWRWLACLTASSLVGACLYRKEFLHRSSSLVEKYQLSLCPLFFLRACFLSCLDFFEALGLHPAAICKVSEDDFRTLAEKLCLAGDDALLTLTTAYSCAASKSLNGKGLCWKTTFYGNISRNRHMDTLSEKAVQQEGEDLLTELIEALYIWHVWFFAKVLHKLPVRNPSSLVATLIRLSQKKSIKATSSAIAQSQKTQKPSVLAFSKAPESQQSHFVRETRSKKQQKACQQGEGGIHQDVAPSRSRGVPPAEASPQTTTSLAVGRSQQSPKPTVPLIPKASDSQQSRGGRQTTSKSEQEARQQGEGGSPQGVASSHPPRAPPGPASRQTGPSPKTAEHRPSASLDVEVSSRLPDTLSRLSESSHGLLMNVVGKMKDALSPYTTAERADDDNAWHRRCELLKKGVAALVDPDYDTEKDKHMSTPLSLGVLATVVKELAEIQSCTTDPVLLHFSQLILTSNSQFKATGKLAWLDTMTSVSESPLFGTDKKCMWVNTVSSGMVPRCDKDDTVTTVASKASLPSRQSGKSGWAADSGGGHNLRVKALMKQAKAHGAKKDASDGPRPGVGVVSKTRRAIVDSNDTKGTQSKRTKDESSHTAVSRKKAKPLPRGRGQTSAQRQTTSKAASKVGTTQRTIASARSSLGRRSTETAGPAKDSPKHLTSPSGRKKRHTDPPSSGTPQRRQRENVKRTSPRNKKTGGPGAATH